MMWVTPEKTPQSPHGGNFCRPVGWGEQYVSNDMAARNGASSIIFS